MKKNVAEFQWAIWITFALQNWILDFGRPIAMLVFPLEWFPMNKPSVGDYFHMTYNVITPILLYQLMRTASRKPNELLLNLCMIFFIMGASIHLVGDSVNHRLSLIGYELHLSVADNPIMQKLEPKELVKSFELLYFYDEVLGHYMWYIPYFICLVLYFKNCFRNKNEVEKEFCWMGSILKNLLILISSSYYWYLVTEGQITPLFLISLACMKLIVFYNMMFTENYLDKNGSFLMITFDLTLLFVIGWSYYFWDDVMLRQKYPGFIYVPEPWSVYSLHFKDQYKFF